MHAETYVFKYILFNSAERAWGPKARLVALCLGADQRVTTTGVPTETRW
jgi:hypothetical protein